MLSRNHKGTKKQRTSEEQKLRTEGCITSLLIAIQDFLVSGFRCQVSDNSFLTPDT